MSHTRSESLGGNERGGGDKEKWSGKFSFEDHCNF
jgi:hypothetical protein